MMHLATAPDRCLVDGALNVDDKVPWESEGKVSFITFSLPYSLFLLFFSFSWFPSP
jgi:hypothetical protein